VVAEKCFTNQPLAEALTAIGHRLKEQREAQSISISEISGRTKIQQRLLQAIEAGDLTQLPEPVYIQRFIEHFAEALGLHPEEISRDFPVNLPPRFPDVSERRGSTRAPFRLIHLYFIYAALLVTAAAGLLYLNHYSAQPERSPTAAGVR
jgi:cytoskeletal protein RodZ